MGIFDLFGKKKQTQPASVTIAGKTITFDERTKQNLLIDQQALAAYEAKNYSKALELYTRLVDANPSAHQYYQFRGTVYEDMGNDVLAKKDFEKAIELDPSNTTSLYRLAMVYHRRNDLDNAIIYLRRAYNELSKHDDKLGKEFGYKDIMGNSYNNILMVHKRVIAFNLANFLVQKNKLEEGVAILDELIQYCPTYSYPYFVKALVCAQKQQVHEAIELTQKANQYGHPQAQALLTQLMALKNSASTSDDKYAKMVKDATFNPFQITCDPRLQNTQSLPDLRSTFASELSDLYNKLNSFGGTTNDRLRQMASGYVFNLVESYYNNAGYVPKNSLDQIIDQVFESMQQTGFRNAFSSLDDFKYKCYFAFLNR